MSESYEEGGGKKINRMEENGEHIRRKEIKWIRTEENSTENKTTQQWFERKNLVGFYGISTIVGYLMPNLLYTCILNIYDLVGLGLMAYQPL